MFKETRVLEIVGGICICIVGVVMLAAIIISLTDQPKPKVEVVSCDRTLLMLEKCELQRKVLELEKCELQRKLLELEKEQ